MTMDLGRLTIAIGVPWLLGIVWVRYWWERASPGAWAMLAGYGFVAGMLITTLTMRLIDLLGFRQDFWSTCLILLGLIGLGLWLGRDIPWRGWCKSEDSSPEAEPQRWERRGFSIVVAILASRFVGLGLEMTSRPLFAWDAWATWAPKARVWWELKRLAPFVDWAGWVDQSPVVAYTLAGHHYPSTIPLIQLWASLALERWDDSLINVAWLACAVALGLAFYGQTRLLGVKPLPAVVSCYLLLSLPLLNSQVALAGTADIWMASVYGLAVRG